MPLRPSFAALVPALSGVIVALIGLTLLVLGIRLIDLGGSWYYAVAGFFLICSGSMIVIRRREGLWLYGLILLGTVIWSLNEVGLDGWKLFPRIFAPAVVGVWLCLPWVAGHLASTNKPSRNAWVGVCLCAALAVLVVAAGYRTSDMRIRQLGPVAEASASPAANAPPSNMPVSNMPVSNMPVSNTPGPNTPVPAGGVPDGEWRYYGRTADGDRFSPLAQITPDNVAKLTVAWTYRTGDLPLKIDTKKGREFSFENTPIKIGDTLYGCTPHHKIFSLNATTGQQNWMFDPHSDTSANLFVTCRGVAYADTPTAAECPRRIITTTGTARMVALNADTGQPCTSFGDNGFVSLTDHMGDVPPGFHFITSQPLVINNRIILGGWIYDDQTTGEPSGVVRAYDPATGALAWAWDLGRADPTAPLAEGEIYTRSTPNAWGTYTADPTLGLVYLPMGNATPDYFGGDRRPFDDEYSSSIVALDIETGKERWHFQTVHHDLWDFDLPIGPSLVDVTTPDGPIPALVQSTKRGEFFLLDRRDGHSLTAIDEKPAPQNPAPGEHLSPTQPYPVGMPTLAPLDVTEADTWGATPIDQLLCRIDFRQRRYDGQFTPPTVGKYLAYPGFFGVVDWAGASVDPGRKLLVANSSYMPMMMTYVTQADALKAGVEKPWAGWKSDQPYPKLINAANNPQYGTPYAIIIKPWLNTLGVPCVAPPWGKLTAIDLNTRAIAWERPLGTTRKSGLFRTHLGVPLPTGIVSMGGSIMTAGGLVFIAATTDDNFRAFDEKTGKMLWETDLPAGGNATPASYTGSDGRQYVVIAAGGHGGLGTIAGDYVIAYALPKQ